MSNEEKPKPQPLDFLLTGTIVPFIPHFVKPNYITVLRLFLVPLVIWLLLIGEYGWAIIVFLLAAFTDAVDGALARHRNQITELGKIIDPLADKLLIASVVFIIVLKHINFWLALIIIFLEALFVIGAFIQTKKGVHPEANRWGKTKMILQVIAVSLLLLALIFDIDMLISFSANAFYLAVVFAIISLITHGI